MTTRHVALALCCLLALAALPPPATAQSAGCDVAVTHDAFREDAATVDRLANGSSATSMKENTRIEIRQSNSFYKLRAENPNGYCIDFTVKIADRGVPAAKIPGTVTSNDGNHTATWDSTYDFNQSRMHTTVTFSLPPQTTATFAPSELRVISLSWVSRSATKADSVWGRLSERLSEDKPLEKRTYRIDPNEQTQVVVPLTHPETGEPVEEYRAVYSTDGGTTWRVVDTDTDAPVYLREDAADNQLTFTFTQTDAEVRFTANPTLEDKARHEWDTYNSGFDLLGGLFESGSDRETDDDDGWLGWL